jgi:hypothetical protein
MTDKIIVVDGKTYKLVPSDRPDVLDFKKYNEIRSFLYKCYGCSDDVDCVFRINVRSRKTHKLITDDGLLGEKYTIEFGTMQPDYNGAIYFSSNKELELKEELTDFDKQEIIKHIEYNFSNMLKSLKEQRRRQDDNIIIVNDYLDCVCKELDLTIEELRVLYNNSEKEYKNDKKNV